MKNEKSKCIFISLVNRVCQGFDHLIRKEKFLMMRLKFSQQFLSSMDKESPQTVCAHATPSNYSVV